MANFSLVVNSKFNPFSFERYIQPYQIYGQAYREVENTLGELDTKLMNRLTLMLTRCTRPMQMTLKNKQVS